MGWCRENGRTYPTYQCQCMDHQRLSWAGLSTVSEGTSSLGYSCRWVWTRRSGSGSSIWVSLWISRVGETQQSWRTRLSNLGHRGHLCTRNRKESWREYWDWREWTIREDTKILHFALSITRSTLSRRRFTSSVLSQRNGSSTTQVGDWGAFLITISIPLFK